MTETATPNLSSRRLARATLAVAVGLLAAATAVAQVEIDKRRPAPARGEVRVESAFGSIVVRGWDRDEIHVTGRLAAGAEGLDLDGDDEGVSIDVDVPESWYFSSEDAKGYRSTLEIRVPTGSRVEIETLEASVEIAGVSGTVEVETVHGPVRVSGDPAAVEIETMTGDVVVEVRSAPMSVETTSGNVALRGVTGAAEVRSVTGSVEVDGARLREVDLETVSGDVTLRGSLDPAGADVEIESHEGAVTMELPAATRARFELRTFSGSIESDFGPPPSREGRMDPFLSLRFSTGLGDSEVRVETFQSDIRLRGSE